MDRRRPRDPGSRSRAGRGRPFVPRGRTERWRMRRRPRRAPGAKGRGGRAGSRDREVALLALPSFGPPSTGVAAVRGQQPEHAPAVRRARRQELDRERWLDVAAAASAGPARARPRLDVLHAAARLLDDRGDVDRVAGVLDVDRHLARARPASVLARRAPSSPSRWIAAPSADGFGRREVRAPALQLARSPCRRTRQA